MTVPVLEASMLRSSPQHSARRAPAVLVLPGLLVAFATACARPAGVSHIEPDEAAPPDTVQAADLTSDDIEKRPQEPLEVMLQARASGVRVSVNPDGSISLRIRGASSFYSNSEPLIVVDGSPLSQGSGGTLRGINPHDIESIAVLKNPSDTALYGMRGGNGVIVVTTKRPLR